MGELTSAVMLGVGVGAVYALLAQGIALIYRGSGVLNFSQGAFAMVGAFSFNEMVGGIPVSFGPALPHLPVAEALVVALLITGILGLLTSQLIMRRLRAASPLVRIIATLGVMITLNAVGTLRYGAAQVIGPTSLLPTEPVHFFGTTVGRDRLWLALLVAVLSFVLWALFRYTRTGLATSGAAENERAAAALGWSPELLASLNWTFGAMLAAVAGILIAPIAGLTVTNMTLILIAGLAAGLIGGFVSFPLILLGGLGLGIAEQLTSQYVSTPGVSGAVPFLVIVAYLVVRGRSLPQRGHLFDRLPRLGTGRIRPVTVAVGTIAGALLLARVLSGAWVAGITVSLGAALVMLSIVVVTGYGGQISLAQFSLAGVGALIAGRIVYSLHWPFEVAVILAVLGTAAVGVLVGIPALRTRGVSLAVVTLGLGVTIQDVVFNSASFTGTPAGTPVGAQTLFGFNIGTIDHPVRYALVSLFAFVVCGLAVANLRRSRSGRQLVAVRDNERAAASMGVSVVGIKLYAFALSAALAAVGGVLIGFQGGTIDFLASFYPLQSISALALATIGGLGYVIGPLIGSTLTSSGAASVLSQGSQSTGQYLGLIGGLLLLLLLVVAPDGLASVAEQALARFPNLTFRLRRTATSATESMESVPTVSQRVQPAHLVVSGLSVRFGGVIAVEDLSFDVSAGEVLGLIGPNGAGKTTVVDAVSGFVNAQEGTVTINKRVLDRLSPHRRSRLGLARSFQGVELFDDLSVLENLQVVDDGASVWRRVTDLVWPGRIPLHPAALAAVKAFGLEQDLEAKPPELSFGRRRLVAIARAVAADPSVLLLDEPAAGLDDHESAELATLVRRLADEWGIAVLLIEHDMDFVFGACDRIIVLQSGRQIATGSTDEIRDDPAVIEAYLGDESAEGALESAVAEPAPRTVSGVSP